MRRVAPCLVVAVLALYGTPAGAEEATSSSAQAPASAEGAGLVGLVDLLDDGEPCTGVPNSIAALFDFTSSCEAHDRCYSEGVDRLACDLEFRANLTEACVTQHPDAFDPGRYVCIALAELYFVGVRLFGGFFFPS